MAKGKRNKALKNIPTKEKSRNTTQDQVSIQHEQFQGPIPPPAILKGYETLLPGSADRILAMAEKETDHRHRMEEKALNAEIKGLLNEALDTRVGQICGLLIGIVTIVSGTYAAVNDAQLAGSLIGTSGVVGLVSAFIVGKKSIPTNNKTEQTKEVVPVDQK